MLIMRDYSTRLNGRTTSSPYGLYLADKANIYFPHATFNENPGFFATFSVGMLDDALTTAH
jgi:hypothetical protein